MSPKARSTLIQRVSTATGWVARFEGDTLLAVEPTFGSGGGIVLYGPDAPDETTETWMIARIKRIEGQTYVVKPPAQKQRLGTPPIPTPKYAEARASGYSGATCGECGSMRMRNNGTCMLCEGCGATTGCS